jgi:hypothetical protein
VSPAPAAIRKTRYAMLRRTSVPLDPVFWGRWYDEGRPCRRGWEWGDPRSHRLRQARVPKMRRITTIFRMAARGSPRRPQGAGGGDRKAGYGPAKLARRSKPPFPAAYRTRPNPGPPLGRAAIAGKPVRARKAAAGGGIGSGGRTACPDGRREAASRDARPARTGRQLRAEAVRPKRSVGAEGAGGRRTRRLKGKKREGG